MKGIRQRRSAATARTVILAAAEQLLVEGGVSAIQVRAVARRAAMTDAGVTHHFGDLHGLLTALIESSGNRIRREIDAVVATWLSGERDVEQLLRAVAAPYQKGLAELAVALHATGWRDRGAPIFGPVVTAIHAARTARPDGARPRPIDTQLAIAAFHHAIATDPLFGEEFRRSAGATTGEHGGAAQQLDWWIRTLRSSLNL